MVLCGQLFHSHKQVLEVTMRSLLGVVILCCVLSAPTFGQSSYATLGGTISDASGALIPGVTVTATNNATGVVSTAISNEVGVYNLPSLLPGVYKVAAELPGFQTQA